MVQTLEMLDRGEDLNPAAWAARKEAAVVDCGSQAHGQTVQAALGQGALRVSEEAGLGRQVDASQEVAKGNPPILSPPEANITMPSGDVATFQQSVSPRGEQHA